MSLPNMGASDGRDEPKRSALTNEPTSLRQPLIGIALLGFLSSLAYLAVALCSQSLHEAGSGKHSLLLLLGLFAFAFGCYLAAIRAALKAPQDGNLLTVVVVAALVFRGILLVSDPIEEIDLYRYLWDGVVSTQGISPFRFSPQQILGVVPGDEIPDDLARLVAIRDGSPVMTTVLKRVHYGELPTIYPPVSQAVFALAAWTTPSTASLSLRMIVMKAWFVGFDLATIFLVVRLLRFAGRPIGWSLVYAWCPLLIKEVANSGHLDALAVFLTTWSIYLSALVLFDSKNSAFKHRVAIAGALLLALAVGAKLYPVVLAPLLFFSLYRHSGWRATVGPALVFGVTMVILAGPMWPPQQNHARDSVELLDSAHVAILPDDAPPLPPPAVSTEPRDPSQSLKAFLGRWEMNDFFFLLVMENLRPTAHLPAREVAWFSVVPEDWRNGLTNSLTTCLAVDADRIPFFLTRTILSVIFFVLALGFAFRSAKATTPTDWLECGFLTVAWFWLLLPTLNPWYWTWALPLLPFARNRAWILMSGLTFLYYFRFWLTHNFTGTQLLGTGYNGPLFFDYVVVWLEFFPWLIYLAVGWLQSPLSNRAPCDPKGNWRQACQL